MMRWLPLAFLAVLAVVLGIGLTQDPHRLPNMLKDRPAPKFSAQTLDGQQFSLEQLKGKPVLLNVFASWCPTCVYENPVLLDFQRSSEIVVLGLAYKDAPEDTKAWLQRHGNPYDTVALDPDGRIGIDFGITGAPESFFIDKEGVVRAKVVGELNWENLADYVKHIQ
jgi:cytochrome c biogenesis protein CcmG/thiol:disulfide interchange protein DsbE